MKIKWFTTLILAALSVGSAQAGSFNGSVMGPEGDSFNFIVPYQSAYYYFLDFTISKTSSLKATAIANNLSSADLVNNEVDFYNYDSGEYLGYFTFGTIATPVYFNNLAAGHYAYEIFGENTGNQIGRVSFSSTYASAVPEPSTYTLLLAGLGLIGFTLRRRRIL